MADVDQEPILSREGWLRQFRTAGFRGGLSEQFEEEGFVQVGQVFLGRCGE